MMCGVYPIRGGTVVWLKWLGIKVRRVGSELFSERGKGVVLRGWRVLLVKPIRRRSAA